MTPGDNDPWADADDEEFPGLGPCCCCGEEGPLVRNVVCLHHKAPLPGRGWGCLVCGLPHDGAIAVTCDTCRDAQRPLVWACRGYPVDDGRVPIGELAGDYRHDLRAHDALG